MNKRIQELAEQAGITLSQKDFSYYWVESAEDIEKFGALIVKECADIALREEHDPYECILKHFGIETPDSTMRNRSTYFGNDL